MPGNPSEDTYAYELEGEEPLSLQVEDDTPEEDRGRTPLPKEIVDELEADELEDYSEKVKIRLKQMKKVWHDERREKERALREQQEAVSFAQRILEENRNLKSTLFEGEKTLVGSFKNSAELEVDAAKKAFKEAYEAGDSDKVVEAQERLSAATYRLNSLNNYQPALQPEYAPVQTPVQQQPAAPRIDSKTAAWQERNTWWGTDPEMTATALGHHQKLEKQHGASYVGSDEYWRSIDDTMRRRYPEYFGGSESATGGRSSARQDARPATVVAPASRSTSSKTVKLKQSQVNLARRLGLTPEQYAKEFAKLENM
jgi:hypothetical protein